MSIQTVVRAGNWWSSKIPPLLAIAYAEILAHDLPWDLSARLVLAVLWSICAVASYGHVINDAFDIEQDRQAGKRNFMAPYTPAQRALFAALTVAAGVLPLAWVNVGWTAWSLLAVNYLLPTVYSIPPLRFKERGILGVLCDTSGAHAVPTLFITQAFAHNAVGSPPATALAGLATLWAFLFGLKGILNHMIADRESDIAGGARTFAVQTDPTGTLRFVTRVLYWLEIAAFVGVTAVLTALIPVLPILLVLYCGLEITKGALGWKFSFDASGRYQRPNVPFANNRFYELWLPVALVGQLAWNDPVYLALAALHLVLFRANLLEQARDLGLFARDAAAALRNRRYRRAFGAVIRTTPECRAELVPIGGPQPAFRAIIAATDGTDWHAKVLLGAYSARKDQFFRLRFQVRADLPRPLAFGVCHGHDPWDPIGLAESGRGDETWRAWEADFRASADDDRAAVYFWIGASTIAVEVREVTLAECPASAVRRLDRGHGCEAYLIAAEDPDAVRVLLPRVDQGADHVKLSVGRYALVAGNAYQVRFRARADRFRWIRFGVGQAESPWTSLDLSEETALDGEWRWIERDFIVHEAEPAACVYFHLGEDEAAVELAEVSLVPSSNRHPWLLETHGSARARQSALPGGAAAARVEIDHPGELPEGVKLSHPGWSVARGRAYRVRFRARADGQRPIVVETSQARAPWEGLGLSDQVHLTTEWREYMRDFVATADEASSAVRFSVGQSPLGVEVAAVALAAVPPERMWHLDRPRGADAELFAVDAGGEAARVEIARAPGPPASIKLSAGHQSLKADQPYRLTVRLRADRSRWIGLGIAQFAEPWANLGLAEEVDLGPDWRIIERDFLASATDEAATAYFWLGEEPGAIEFAEVTITPGSQPDPWRLAAHPDARGERLDAAPDRARVAVVRGTDDPFRLDLARGFWPVSGGENYELRFRARSDRPVTIAVGWTDSGDSRREVAPASQVDLDATWRTFLCPARPDFAAAKTTAHFGLATAGPGRGNTDESGAAAPIVEIDTVTFVAVHPAEAWRLDRSADHRAQLLTSALGPRSVRVAPRGSGIEGDVKLWHGRFETRQDQVYTVRWHARADQTRWIRVSVAQTHEPWRTLGLAEPWEITPEWREYALDFRATADETAAAIVFALGEDDAAVDIGEIEVRPTAAPEPWRLETVGTGKARRAAPPSDANDPSSIRVAIHQTDGHPASIQLSRGQWSVERGMAYRLRLRARSEGARGIGIHLLQPDEPWGGLGLSAQADLADFWRTVVVDFVATQTESRARLSLLLGSSDQPVEIGMAELVPLGDQPRWHVDLRAPARAQLLETGDSTQAIKVAIANAGTDQGDIKLSQEPVEWTAGKQYLLAFRARADRSRWIRFGVSLAAPPWNSLGLNLEAELDGDWGEWAADFVAQASPAAGPAAIHFLLGESPAGVEVADVRLAEAQGVQPWRIESAPSGRARLLEASAEGGALVEILRPGAAPRDLKVLSRYWPTESDKWYRLRFRARGIRARTLTVEVAGTYAPWAWLGLTSEIELTDGWRGYFADFRATADDPWASIQFCLGGDGTGVELADPELSPRAPTDTWRLGSEGLARARLVELEGSSSGARVEIAAVDKVPGHVKLAHGCFSLVGQQAYQLRFRARADRARWLSLGVSQSESPWAGLGLAEEVELTASWTDFQLEFLATMDDPNVAVQFLLGESIGAVEIDAVGMAETTLANTWRLEAHLPARATRRAFRADTDRDGGGGSGVTVTIVEPGPVPGAIKLLRDVGAVEADRVYRLRFRARARAARAIGMDVAQAHDPWRGLGLSDTVGLIETWRDYLRDFTASASDNAVAVQFSLGQESADVEIRDLSLAPAPPAGHWRLDRAPGHRAMLLASSTGDNAILCLVDQTDGRADQIKLSFGERPIVAGRAYRITLRARAERARWLGVGVSQTRAPWRNLGLADEVELSRDWQTVTRCFVATDDDPAAAIQFHLGDSVGAVEFAMVEWEPWRGGPPWQLERQAGCRAVLSGPPPDEPASEPSDGAVRVQLVRTDGEAWHVRLLQAGAATEAGKAARLRFLARADFPRPLRYVVSQNHEPWENLGPVELVELTTDWQLFVSDFVPSQADDRARIQFGLGDSAIGVELAAVTLAPCDDAGPWLLTHADTCQAQLVGVPERAGERVVRVGRTDGATWNIKLTRAVGSVAEGAAYGLYFRARAEQPRSMVVGLAQIRAPWRSLGPTESIELGTQWQAFSVHFTAKGDEANAGAVFALGASAAAVSLADLTLERLPEGNHWRLERHPACRARLLVDEEGLVRVSIPRADGIAEHISAHFAPVPLTVGQDYLVRFGIRADFPRPVHVTLKQNHPPWSHLGLSEEIEASTEWQTVIATFTATVDEPGGTLVFGLGAATGTVVLENVIVVPCPPEFGWRLERSGASRAQLCLAPPGNKAQMASTTVRAVVTANDGEPWHLKLTRRQVAVTAGVDYTVRFRARADAARRVGCALARTESPWTNLGLTGEVELIPRWRSFRLDFRASATDERAAILFGLGGANGGIEIADLSVARCLGPRWRFEGQGGTRGQLETLEETDGGEGGIRVAVFAVDGDPWHARLVLAPVALPNKGAFRVSIRARASFPRAALVGVGEHHSPWQNLGLMEPIQLSTEWRTYLCDFVARAADDDGCLFFCLGEDAIALELADVAVAPIPTHSAWLWRRAEGALAQRLAPTEGAIENHDTAAVEIVAPGTAAGDLKLARPIGAMAAGTDYRLSFRARAEQPRLLAIAVAQPSAPWQNLGVSETVLLTTVWQTFLFDFRARGTEPDAVAEFLLGGSSHAARFADVSFAPCPPAGPWRLDRHDGCRAQLTLPGAEAETVRATLLDPGQAEWWVTLSRPVAPLRGGTSYQARFRARADHARTVIVGVGQAVAPWENLGLHRAVPLGPEWSEVALPLVALRDEAHPRLYFWLGGSVVPVELSTVELALVDPPPARETIPGPADSAAVQGPAIATEPSVK